MPKFLSCSPKFDLSLYPKIYGAVFVEEHHTLWNGWVVSRFPNVPNFVEISLVTTCNNLEFRLK